MCIWRPSAHGNSMAGGRLNCAACGPLSSAWHPLHVYQQVAIYHIDCVLKTRVWKTYTSFISTDIQDLFP